jgi:pimeloyl-ACP methyl ester carboxylesterase
VFLQIVYVSTFIGQLLPFVPALVRGVVDDNNVVLETLAPYTLIVTSGVSLGASYVINCNEEFGLTDASEVADLVSRADVRPELASGEFAGSFDTFRICDEYDMEPAFASEDTAVQSDVPSLVIAGEFDPITPPSYAAIATETLPNSVTVVITGVAHDPVSSGGLCGFAVVGAFLSDPIHALDTSCTDDVPLEFVIVP